MFDISWTEFLLIGVVALIVIGPKELPGVLRTLGQYTRKVRGMAADFQNQFQEAMREAEMADLKKQVDEVAQDVRNFDPLKGVRDDVASVGKDFERSLGPTTPEPAPATTEPLPEPLPRPAETGAVSAAEHGATSEEVARTVEPVGASAVAATTQATDKAAPADEMGRTGS